MDLKLLIGDAQLTENDYIILKYIVNNIDKLEQVSIRQLAKTLYTSPATIIRLAHKLNFSGYTDLYYFILHNKQKQKRISSNFKNVDHVLSLELFGQDTVDIFNMIKEKINNKQYKLIVLSSTGFAGLITQYLYKKLINQGHRVMYSGGEDSSGIIKQNLHNIVIFLAISKSGETETLLEKVKACQKEKIPTIAITGNERSRLAKLADHLIMVPDSNPMDSQNITYNDFYINLTYLFELMAAYLSKQD